MDNRRERDDIKSSKSERSGNKHGRGNRNLRRDSGRDRDSNRGGMTHLGFKSEKQSFNDPEWYALNEQIAKDAGSFSFMQATGSPITLTQGVAFANYNTCIPGTYSIYVIPAPGRSEFENSALNLAMRSFFRNVRKGNAGATNYDATDMMLYILAMDSLFAWYAALCRLYGLGRVYSQYNRYYADGLTMAQGFSPAILDDMSRLRGYINQLCLKINQFAVPNTLTLFKRHYWMFSNAFRDGDTAKAQVYFYVPQALYMYDELNGPGQDVLIDVCGTVDSANGCQPRPSLTFANIEAITNTLINALVKSQDANIMSGDIVKYYGDSLFKVSMINEDFTVIPAYAPEVLMQIHNTTYAGRQLLKTGSIISSLGYDSANITQTTSINGGFLVCNPYFRGANSIDVDKIMDMPMMTPDPKSVLVASRNMLHGVGTYDPTADASLYNLAAFASDIPLYFTIGQNVYQNGTMTFTLTVYGCDKYLQATTQLNLLQQMAYFDWAPRFYNVDTTSGLKQLVGEAENWRVMTYSDLERLHNAAIMSMLALPEYGSN